MQQDDRDWLVPDWNVRKQLGISAMTLYRWTNNPTMGFPPPIKLSGPNGRNFHSGRTYDAFIEERKREAEQAVLQTIKRREEAKGRRS